MLNKATFKLISDVSLLFLCGLCFVIQGSDTPAEGLFFQQEDEHRREGADEVD